MINSIANINALNCEILDLTHKAINLQIHIRVKAEEEAAEDNGKSLELAAELFYDLCDTEQLASKKLTNIKALIDNDWELLEQDEVVVALKSAEDNYKIIDEIFDDVIDVLENAGKTYKITWDLF